MNGKHIWFLYMPTNNVEVLYTHVPFNTLAPWPYFLKIAEDIFKLMWWNENVSIWMNISINVVPYGVICNTWALVAVIIWQRHATSHYLNQSTPSSMRPICVTISQTLKKYLFLDSLIVIDFVIFFIYFFIACLIYLLIDCLCHSGTQQVNQSISFIPIFYKAYWCSQLHVTLMSSMM